MDLKGKKVTIVGAARSGVAAANLVLQQGGILKITDAKPLADIEPSLAGLRDRSAVIIESGAHTRAFVEDSDLVVASPGVWRTAEPLAWAREKRIPVMGEIEFAWRFCKAPVIAVTGSNGKTTTVTLITEVLKAAGKNVCLCGNVGTPFSQHVLTPGIDFFIVEISSFQLELIETFRPHVALLTNFSQNHLDRHPDMQDYFNAKVRLFMNQTPSDFALFNAQDEWSMKASGHTRAKVVTFNEKGEVRDANHVAVAQIARILGTPDEITLSVLASFKTIEHRREFVRSLDGVDYVNDSKSTTVEAGRWALERAQKPLVIIVGGSDKHMDYTPLKDLVKQKVRIMLSMGAIRQQFKDTFDDVVRVDVIDGPMDEVVAHARRIAQPGECILLSPMTASFDMFDNFEHRGEVFKQIVQGLK
jgi:UDP-N-acetylmuramoylalanine--D-glutamate ligase